MRYKIGRFFQVLGLILLPIGIAGNLARPDVIGVGKMLTTLAAGMGVFYLGRFIQGQSSPGA